MTLTDANPPIPSPWFSLSSISQELPPDQWRCEILATVDSTNAHTLRLLRQSTTEMSQHCLVFSHKQTAGKGRLGRQWQWSPGNFSGSYGFLTTRPLQEWDGLPLMVALTTLELLEHYHSDLKPHLKIKWPNDIVYVDNEKTPKKLGGILIEVQHRPELPHAMVIGLGLNWQTPTYSLPTALKTDAVPASKSAIPSLPPIGLADIIHSHNPDSPMTYMNFLPRWAQNLRTRLTQVHTLNQCLHHWINQCQDRLLWKGEMIDVLNDNHTTQGILHGLNASGHLLISTPTGIITLHSGDVSVRQHQQQPLSNDQYAT